VNALPSSTGKILIVDDHLDLAENLAEILADAGYEAVTAASAEEGLERIAAGGIVGLITDYRLPGLNGVQLIQEARRRCGPLPTVVMSAYADDETIERARAAGAADVLSKPVALDRLLALVAGMSDGEGLILLVDDNRAFADDLAEILRAQGHSATICGSLAEVRALATSPTVAVLDYRLPDGTGVDVAKELLARNAGTQFLFISGHGGELQSRLGSEPALRSTQLEKPIDIERLLIWVAAALQRGTPASPRR
jgi:DNA-binding NtrC family response regulator